MMVESQIVVILRDWSKKSLFHGHTHGQKIGRLGIAIHQILNFNFRLRYFAGRFFSGVGRFIRCREVWYQKEIEIDF